MFDKQLNCAAALMLLLFFSLAVDSSDYFTCDFDLENIVAIVPHLPAACQQLFAVRQEQPEVFDLYSKEAQQFGDFYNKLAAADAKAVNDFAGDLRMAIYSNPQLPNCAIEGQTEGVANATTFLQCQIKRYGQLSAEVPV